MLKTMIYILILMVCTSCSEILLLSSGAGLVASQSPVVKAYNGADMLTIMKTKKDIKKHIYEGVKHDRKKQDNNIRKSD
jgi:hypothetical protein|tara:strand:- start:260 stop:496 length:237 start_codon:yes stop_codon:yes gene_type:complete